MRSRSQPRVSGGHIALTVAMLIELGYFPEQVASDRSPFSAMRELWELQHAGLVESVRALCAGAGGGGT